MTFTYYVGLLLLLVLVFCGVFVRAGIKEKSNKKIIISIVSFVVFTIVLFGIFTYFITMM